MGRVQDLLYLTFTLGSLNGAADAFWRLPCRGRSQLGLIDPIVDPGEASGHVHTIQGGNAIGLDNSPQDLQNSDCTSCGVAQDKSAYWTPAFYFLHKNGSAELLEQPGGMLAYYLLFQNSGEELVEFPKGFQMVAGSAHRRNFTCEIPEPAKSLWSGSEVTQDALEQKALGFNCLNYKKQPEASLGRHFLPEKSFIDENCPDGVRFEIFFPSCWNGKDAKSDDHKSHMAYPSLVNGGTCPEGYNKRVPSLFYETIWATAPFKDQEGDFVISNGDPTGFGYHADFQASWDDGFLNKAIKTCTNPSGNVEDCPIFDLVDQGKMQQCKAPSPKSLADMNCENPDDGLPGNNPIQAGPEPAVKGKSHGKSHEKPKDKHQVSASISSEFADATTIAKPEAPQSASSVVDAHGGGKVFANAPPSSVASSAASTSSASSVEVVHAAAVSSVTTSPTDSAPESDPTATVITSGGAVWDIKFDYVTETVTATGPSPAADNHHKRHLHNHMHNHHHHF